MQMQSCLYKYFLSRVEITGDQPILIKSSPWYDEPKFRYPVQNKNCREKASASSKEKRLQNKLKWLMSLSYPYLRKPRKDREDLEFRGEKYVQLYAAGNQDNQTIMPNSCSATN
jgi:hypothetical protein